ncbi:MAG: oligosaccharide flippase family protein, partial [candidate division KSB1 bacterium]
MAVLVGQALTMLANLGVTVLLARYCGKENFGIFSYALAYVGFFAVLIDFGMQAILIREISSRRWPLAEILGNALRIKAVLFLVVVVLMVATAWIVGYSDKLVCVIAILAL